MPLKYFMTDGAGRSGRPQGPVIFFLITNQAQHNSTRGSPLRNSEGVALKIGRERDGGEAC